MQQRKEESGRSLARHLTWETDDNCIVESSVLFIHNRKIPWVICLPCATGCGEKCIICAVSAAKKYRNLHYKELNAILTKSIEFIENKEIYQISFMGGGEPFFNSNNLFRFCEKTLNISTQIIIGISTVGIERGITQLCTKEWGDQIKLQLSLHAWPSEKRIKIIPAESKHPIKKAIDAASDFATKWDRKCSLNYVMLKDFNDSEEDAYNILKVINPELFYLKISEFNPNKYCKLNHSSPEKVKNFIDILRNNGIEIHRFRSIGTGIGAGCGQTAISLKIPHNSN